ncbi:hypothetical protein [Hylemonella gracilis]|uniref:hypothetical protein n=1 Tax=Hylemonella gracilis TaxID=80880 RepID=UPI0012DEB9FB|nr:hypothetical protein [Hylemonella gracilis]
MLLNVLRDPLATQCFIAIRSMCDLFGTGEYLGSYAQLMHLCTPPKPERGPSRKGPTREVLRGVLDDLEAYGLIARDKSANFNHGQLRIYLAVRKKSNSKPVVKKSRPI